MKRIVTLCMACIMLQASVLAISAAGLAGAGSGLLGSDAGMISQEIASSEGDVSDIGNTARTGDVQNGSSLTGESSAEIPSESGEIGSESTDPGENSTADSDNSADSTQSGSSDQDSGVSWFSVILAIVIVAEIAALIIALLPRRNRM